MPKTVEIPEYRYKDLIHAELKLTCLENMGVDNWTGYEEAMNSYLDLLEEERENNVNNEESHACDEDGRCAVHQEAGTSE